MTLAYPRAVIRHPLDAWGFVVAPTERCTARACTFSSVKYAERAPAGFALLRVYLASDDGGALLERDDTTLACVAHEDVAALLGITAVPVLARVARHRRSSRSTRSATWTGSPLIEARVARLPGLALVGAAYRGVGITDSVRSAEETAERVLGTRAAP